MIKSPVVVGMFYPANPNELMDMMDEQLEQVQLPDINGTVKAVVCPHAGYIYSGSTAAYSYQAIKQQRKNIPKTFVIMAPSHHAYFEGVSIGCYENFEIPGGEIEVDFPLCQEIIKNYPEYFSFKEEAFAQEHALEVQLPFLSHIAESEFNIVPMIYGNTNPIEIGNILHEISKKHEVFFIVSSDLSHYMPYEAAQIKDDATIHTFLEKNTEEIIQKADACGVHPRTALNQIAQKATRNPHLLHYANSGDTAGTKDQVVGYASMIYQSS